MSFRGAKVLSFESRRSKEIAELIRINGGEPFVAPALIEVPLEHNEAALTFAHRLYGGEFDMMIFLTGVGARLLYRVVASREPEERFLAALRKIAIVARGPKPVAVLREWQVPVTVTVPEPNTWRELLNAVESRPEKSVAVQEYGRPNRELNEGLEQQGRRVTTIPVYQWRLPDDTSPLEEALRELLDGKFGAALFTTGVQIEHFLDFAERRKQREAAIGALRGLLVASIGPTCTESLEQCGLTPALEPSHPKMGILVREAAAKFAEQKRT
ncbi:MAG TPA: uroporphyrinogen-III synthase [Bryobacteraceae bacterium]|jgi:uroporphyrinogen-III synthase